MVPTFAKGDMLVITGIAEADIEIGDIIVYEPNPGQVPIVHRVIEKNPGGSFQTKGDANSAQLPFEKEIWYDQILGKVSFVVPYLGWVKIGTTQYILPNFIWVVIVIVILALAYYLAKEIKAKS